MKRLCLLKWFVFLTVMAVASYAAEHRIVSPSGELVVTVCDDNGLHYRVEVYGHEVLTRSRFGLAFKDGTILGPSAVITDTETSRHEGQWENRFGQRRFVPDNWRQLHLTLKQSGDSNRTFGLIARVFDNGIAFRYDLPVESGLGDFVLTDELTEFQFAGDYRCWAGDESGGAENPYPQKKLSDIQSGSPERSYRSVLPLLVETPAGYIAVAESDLLDWAGMAITGTGTSAVKATLCRRGDGNGLVVSTVPRVSPWRVLMFGKKAADLVDSDLIATLATPCRLDDVSWIKPGVSAWDAWWTGTNPFDPAKNTGVDARGTTESHKQYIDLAADMGWQYQLMDWYWYENMWSPSGDFSRVVPEIDIPGLMAYSKAKGVRLLIWANSVTVRSVGIEKSLRQFADMGFAGVKIDFLSNDAQETVCFCKEVVATAAKVHLLIDFHGTYVPTGLARTYPNFITQEGVLGNEYYKLPGNKCTPLHTVTLPFTRGLLGPMDFTPGGFVNRAPDDFKITYPTQVMGTRARQLAMTVIYLSPLQVICDSPKHYLGQPGVDFLRDLPTVWDETKVLQGEVAKSIVMARRSGDRWYLAAMNGDDAIELQTPLAFLGAGTWTLQRFADNTESDDYQAIVESKDTVDAQTVLSLSLKPAGGFAAILNQD
jgi:alpha-glucosidase